MLGVYHDTYYSTIATVIPLFLILGVFEYRALVVRTDLPRPLVIAEAILMPLFVLIFVGAEWYALDTLKHGREPAQWKDDVISIAIVFQLVTLLLMGVTLVLRPLTARWNWFPDVVEDPEHGER